MLSESVGFFGVVQQVLDLALKNDVELVAFIALSANELSYLHFLDPAIL